MTAMQAVIDFGTIFLFGIPGIFLLVIVWRTMREWRDARTDGAPCSIPTEPIVLLILGFSFLAFDVRLIPVTIYAARRQISILNPSISLNLIAAAYGFAAIVLVASVAKVVWTHLNLEEGRWGPILDYRRLIWPDWRSSAAEFVLRIAIAITVVFLQGQIAEFRRIPHTDLLSNSSSEVVTGAIMPEYNGWMAMTSWLGMLFFVFISIWLAIAYRYNRGRDGIQPASRGTFWFAVPGLVLCWSLNYLSTGSPVPSYQISGPPDVQIVLGLTSLVLLAALAMFYNIASTAWKAWHLVEGAG